MKLGIGTLLLVMLIIVFLLPCQIASAPTVVVDPGQAKPGTQIRIDGSGFPGGSPYQILLDGVNVGNGTTYGGGSMYRVLTLQRIIPIGEHNITVVSGSVSGHTTFNAVPWTPSVSTSPAQLRTGQILEICGTGFPPLAYYEIRLDSEEVMAGVTDSEGAMCTDYTIPKMATLGFRVITVTATQYAGPPSATSQVNVTQWHPEIEISPEETNPGGTIEIKGSGFPPSSLYRIKLDGYEILVGTTDTQGKFARIHVLPPSLGLGSHVVRADAVEYAGPPSAMADLPVRQWPATLGHLPEKARPGANLSLIGNGFPPHASFTLRLDGSEIGSGITTGGGTFTVYHYLPSNYTLGPHSLQASVSGYAGPPTAEAVLNVTQWEMEATTSPAVLHGSSRLRIMGSGFPPNASYRAYLDGVQEIASGTSNSSGLVALEYVLSDRITLGTHSIFFRVEAYSGPPTLAVHFNVTQWSLTTTVTPSSARPGSWVYVQGQDYPPGSAYHVRLDGAQIAEGVVSPSASMAVNHQLPRNLSLGSHQLTIDTSFFGLQPVVLTLTVLQWQMTLTVNPKSGLPGANIALGGTGSPPGASLQIFWDGAYVKATDSTQAGVFSSELAAPSSPDNSYHELKVTAAGGYAGPPSVRAYFWLGYFPPTPVIATCSEAGTPLSTFFLGENLCVKGDGYPPSVQMMVHVLREGDSAVKDEAIASVSASTDALGYLPITSTGPLAELGAFRIWADVNGNGFFDANDLIGGALTVVERPDVAVVDLEIAETNPTQGQMVAVGIGIRNEGNVSSSGSVGLLFGDQQVASATYGPLEAGEEELLELSWDTSAAVAGTAPIQARVEPLAGELDTQDNELAGGQVTVKPRPDLSVLWLIPEARSPKKGETIAIRSRFANNGQGTQSFRASILWGGLEILHQDLSLAPGESRALRFEWDTTGATPGSGELVARAEVLPYERDPSDNQLPNGSIVLLPPNRPPSADAGGPYSGTVGELVQFDGTRSLDLDGEIATYRWDFGDGQFAFGSIVAHSYGEPGEYEASLTVTDNDGGQDSLSTSVLVESTLLHRVTLSVIDALNFRPIVGAEVKLGGSTYITGFAPISAELEPGNWTVSVSKAGFDPLADTFELDGDKNLEYPIEPVLDLFACGAAGSMRFDYSAAEVVYACVLAPDVYSCLLFVVGDGAALPAKPLLDLSPGGADLAATTNGSIVVAVWSAGLLPGGYDLVLDVDSDGIYDPLRDVLQSPQGVAFTIPEMFLVFLASGIFGGCLAPRRA